MTEEIEPRAYYSSNPPPKTTRKYLSYLCISPERPKSTARRFITITSVKLPMTSTPFGVKVCQPLLEVGRGVWARPLMTKFLKFGLPQFLGSNGCSYLDDKKERDFRVPSSLPRPVAPVELSYDEWKMVRYGREPRDQKNMKSRRRMKMG